MAAFPSSILWHKSTSYAFDDGIKVSFMDDERPHTQTYITDEVIAIKWVGQNLTWTEVVTVKDFLNANTGVDFDITEPLSGVTYTGKKTGVLSVAYSSDVHYRLSFSFNGREKP